MSDDELEQTLERSLRAMLAERAGDIRHAPGRVPGPPDDTPEDGRGADGEVLDLGLRRADVSRTAARRWPLLLAAAVVAAVLVAVLATLWPGSAPHERTPSLHAPVPTVQRTSCVVADAGQWNADVLAHSITPSGIDAAQGVGIQAVLANGDALIQYVRDGYRSGSIGTELGVLAPGARTPRDLGYFGVPNHGSGTSFSLDVEADVATHVVAVSVEGGVHNRGPFVRSVYALDVDTGHRILLTTQSRYPHGQLQTAYVQDGTVYYEVDASTGSATTVYAVPISGGTPRRVGGGPGTALQQSALGVTWHGNGPLDRPLEVPGVVAGHAAAAAGAADDADSYVTDGTAYAWATDAGALQWFSPRAGRVVSFPHLLGGSSGLSIDAAVTAVAGPLVYFQGTDGDSQWVLDTRTGARVHITSGGTMVGAAGGVAVGDPLLGGGRQAENGEVMRLPTDGLAPLHC